MPPVSSSTGDLVLAPRLIGGTFQAYTGYTQVSNGGGKSANKLFWETSSVSQLIIPDDNFGYAEDIASSPYQITVEWPPGYSQVGSDWETIWGDGVTVGSEVCDDGNIVNGDGWSGDCSSIEVGWVCTGTGYLQKSIWRQWDTSYEPNESSSKWVEQSSSRYINSLATMTVITLSVSTITNLSIMALNAASTHSMFSLLNAIQLFLLLPWIGTHLPFEVISYMISLDFSLISMEFMPKIDLKFIVQMIDYEQADPYLALIDLNSSSAIMNLIDTILFILTLTFALLALWAIQL